MKRTLFIISFVFIYLLSFSQEGLHIGISGQPQNTWIFNLADSDDSREGFTYKPTWGYAGMFKIGYNFGPPLGLHLGAIWSQQGQQHYSTDSTGAEHLMRRDQTYLKIPLLLHINSDPAPVMFAFELGPQLGLIQNASYTDDGNPLNLPFETVTLYKPKDIAFAWSIGVEFALTEVVHFTLMHRGDYSILDVEDKTLTVNGIPFYNPGRDASKNATFGISAGFVFCFLPQGSGRNTRYWIR